jgi:uncharacterized protein YcbK (DUF882 family)
VKAQDSAKVSRRSLLGIAAGLTVACIAPRALATPSILRGAGDVRVIRMVNPRTSEKINTVYWVDGQYIPEVLTEIDHLMRDWRTDQVKRIDPGLLDIVSATHTLLDTSEPFTLFSGYRSPRTNSMLAMRSRGVARDSYHVKGMAADLHLDSRSVRQVAAAASRLNAGGIGTYSRSDFVHLDCGPPRDWGR